MPRLKRTARLRRQSEFETVRRAGVTASVAAMKMAAAPGNMKRLGTIASRAVGGAVVRNRLKRIIREHFRLCQDDYPKADCVVILRPLAARISPTEVRSQLDRVLRLLKGRIHE